MKKIFLVIVSLIAGITANAQVTYNAKYDINGDGVVNAADVAAVVAYINGHSSPGGDTPVSATMIKCTKPTWATSGVMYPYSMQMYVLNGSLPEGLTIGEGDLVGAFIGTQCRCAAEPSYNNGAWHYNLSISGDDEDPSPATVVIRYYSAAKGAYCESNAITYQDGCILGTATSGYALTWK